MIPPWALGYGLLSLYLSQQWIKTWRTNPEHTVVLTVVMVLASYYAYQAYEKYKQGNVLQEALPDKTPMHFLLQHNKRLASAMNLFTNKYKWIDPAAHTDVMKQLNEFLDMYSRLLLKPANSVQHQDAEDALQIRRSMLNNLYSFNVKNASLVHDKRFRDIILTTHSSTYRYLEILRNKHPTLASLLPPTPRAVEQNERMTSFDLV